MLCLPDCKRGGRYTAIVDADLQQPLSMVREMVDFLERHAEYDVVAAYQDKRREKRAISKLKNQFYRIINLISEVDFYQGASDFRTFRGNVREAILELRENNRFSKGIFSWIGFRTFYIPYEANARNAGTTSWSVKKLSSYAINGIISFSTIPLRIATVVGVLVSASAFFYMIFVIIQKVFFGIDIPGYATLLVFVLFLGGTQNIFLGILGEYISKIHIEVKNRPIYIVKSQEDNSEERKTAMDLSRFGGKTDAKKMTFEEIKKNYPKVPAELPEEYKKIWDEHYLDSRNGRTAVTRAASGMEKWLHKKVAGTANKYGDVLEIGAGTLNQLDFEKVPEAGGYDIVEPFRLLYENTENVKQIRNIYSDIAVVPLTNRYRRIISVACFEHICNLPEVVSRCTELLEPDGVMSVSIPNEGRFLWHFAYTMTTGREFHRKFGLDYEVWMQYEHVNTADEIDVISRHFFTDVRMPLFGISKDLSFYRSYECRVPLR